MSSFTTKQSEWQKQVLEAKDLRAQVGRPIDEESWQALVCDIKSKLLFDQTKPVGSLLDIGCGNALILSELAPYTNEVFGIDYAEAMIEQAKKVIPNGHFQTGEAGNLKFKDKQFDRLLCYSIFHYFPSQEYVLQAIAEMIRVTKPGGVILIGDLLDDKHEKTIKSGSDLNYEQKIPHIHRYSEWTFCPLEKIVQHFSAIVHRIEVLDQPMSFQLRHYRKDIRIIR
ncbi:class I SAM-dependent methyltransferase [Colwellia sp. MEBiC06753]